MRKTTIKAILLVFGVLFAFNSYAKKTVHLKMNLKKGASYEFVNKITSNINQSIMGQDVKMIQDMDLIYTCNVEEVLANGNYSISYTINTLEMNMDVNGQKISFNSNDNSDDNPIASIFKELSGFKISFELSPLGKVSNVDGIAAYLEKINSNQLTKQSLGQFTDDKTFAQYISQSYGFFPNKDVAVGESWTSSVSMPSLMNMDIVLNYNLNDLNKKQAVVSVNSEININTPVEKGGISMDLLAKGTQKGLMNVNRNDGFINDSSIEQLFDIKMTMDNPQNGEKLEIPMTVNTKVKVVVNRK